MGGGGACQIFQGPQRELPPPRKKERKKVGTKKNCQTKGGSLLLRQNPTPQFHSISLVEGGFVVLGLKRGKDHLTKLDD